MKIYFSSKAPVKRANSFATVLFFLLFMLLLSSCGNESGSSSARLQKGEIVTLTLIQTSDLQNRVSGTAPSTTYKTSNDLTRGGFARLATKIKGIREEKTVSDTPVILFDTGDALSGTAYDMIVEDNKTAPAFAFFTAMEYDAITLGGGDFLYGVETLPKYITNAKGENGNGFSIPILLSNLQTDNLDNSADDALEALREDKTISESALLTLDNGLLVGVISIMGSDASTAITGAVAPASFVTDYSTIQAKINSIRNYNPDIVVALMHASLNYKECPEPDPDPEAEKCENYYGDGRDISENVYGVDIFLSGSGRERTAILFPGDVKSILDQIDGSGFQGDELIEVYDTNLHKEADLVLNPVLFSPGKHGEYLSQLDLTIKIGTGIKKATLTAHDIDQTVTPDPPVDSLVGLMDDELDKLLADKNMPEINSVLGAADVSLDLTKKSIAGENVLGNLVADSFRYAFKTIIEDAVTPFPPTIGLVGNGLIQNGMMSEADISFADMFTVLPLGNSLDPTQVKRPGYPLIKAYLSGQEIVNLCQFSAYTRGAQESGDDGFMGILSAKTGVFLRDGIDLQASTDYKRWMDELEAKKTTGDTGDDTYPDDYYTVKYASDAYDALVAGVPSPNQNSNPPAVGYEAYCDCDDEDDPGYDETPPCTCVDFNWEAAGNVYKEGATLFSSMTTFLRGLTPENYINLSGVTYTHREKESLYKVEQDATHKNVKLYVNTDFACIDNTTLEDIDLDKEYPFATDLFTLLILTDTDIRNSLGNIDIEIKPESASGVYAFYETAMKTPFRFDISPSTDPDYVGSIHEELKCWQTLYNYISTGLNGTISEADYNSKDRIFQYCDCDDPGEINYDAGNPDACECSDPW